MLKPLRDSALNISINNQPFELVDGTPLEQALVEFGARPPYAILFNESFLPQSQYSDTQLIEGDSVEVISAIQGG